MGAGRSPKRSKPRGIRLAKVRAEARYRPNRLGVREPSHQGPAAWLLRLFAEPGRLEGRVAIREELDAHDPVVSNRPDLRVGRPLQFDSADPPSHALAEDRDDVLPRIDEVLVLEAGGFPCGEPGAPEGPDALMPVVHR